MFVEMKSEGEAAIKPDIFSLAAFMAWLEKQPADKTYDWYDIDGCLLCLYLRDATGVARPAGQSWPNGTGGLGPDTLGRAWGYGNICAERPWTFGAALKRARSL